MTVRTQNLLRTGCRFRWGLAAAGLMLAASGCGSKAPHSERPWLNAQVTVMANGEPLAAGEVALLATQGSTGVDAGGFVDAKGTVRIPVLPGSYVAVIRPIPPPEDDAATASVAADVTGPRTIPKRYRSPATSPFAVEIREDEKHIFTFELAP